MKINPIKAMNVKKNIFGRHSNIESFIKAAKNYLEPGAKVEIVITNKNGKTIKYGATVSEEDYAEVNDLIK